MWGIYCGRFGKMLSDPALGMYKSWPRREYLGAVEEENTLSEIFYG